MNLVLHITKKCNFSCQYCFVNKQEEVMNLQTAKGAIDLLPKGQKHQVSFFGGEPLLEKELIYDIVNYCLKKCELVPKFLLTTNGSLLDDEFIEFAKTHNFEVAISNDGLCQDMGRLTCDGKSTFKIVNRNCIKLLDVLPYSAAMLTLKTDAVGSFADSVNFLFLLGFKTVATTIDHRTDAGWTKRLLKKLKREYKKIAKNVIQRIENGENVEVAEIFGKISMHVKSKCDTCDLGLKDINIDCDGNVYPCVQFVGNKDYYMGHTDTGIDRNKQLDIFKQSIFYIPKCNVCKYVARCKHKCCCLNFSMTGDFKQVWWVRCEYEKILIDTADYVGNYLYKKKNKIFMKRYYNK